MRKATIVLTTEHGERLEAALAPEARRALPRTTVSTSSREDGFRLDIEARDTSALRAALNSYLRWISTALKMMKEARG